MLLVRRWAVISAVLLISTISLLYMGIVKYAQSIRTPYDGISVSEEVDLIVGQLSLWNSCFFGLFMLGATVLCWRALLSRSPEQDAIQQRKIKVSLVLISLVSCALYMLVSYSQGTLISTSFESHGSGIPTPTPIRTR